MRMPLISRFLREEARSPGPEMRCRAAGPVKSEVRAFLGAAPVRTQKALLLRALARLHPEYSF